uniref:Uncharacterized protein n=1 Tax=Amphimedon queenslandica TaxID=400682 RepID=A0A1X7U8G6_AMPQE
MKAMEDRRLRKRCSPSDESSEDDDSSDSEKKEEEEEKESTFIDGEDFDGLPCTLKLKKKVSAYALDVSLQSGRYPEFKGLEGPSPVVDHSMSPFDLVKLFWPDSLCELTAKETNRDNCSDGNSSFA